MKMQLLTVSIFLFIVNCCSRGNESIQIDDYVFCSLYKFGQQIEMDKNTDVIYNIKNSKKIKGPVIGMDIKTLILVNKTNKGDTLKVTIYGNKNKYFGTEKEWGELLSCPAFQPCVVHDENDDEKTSVCNIMWNK